MSFSCEAKKEKLINKECSQTIRTPRKNPIEVGDRLQIYWKVRKAKDSKDVHKIGEGIVTDIFEITFVPDGWGHYIETPFEVKESVEEIAKKDGFRDKEHLYKWFTDRYGFDEFPITFKVIRWRWVD